MEEAQAFQMDDELLQDSLFFSCRSLSVGKIRLYDTYFTHSVCGEDIQWWTGEFRLTFFNDNNIGTCIDFTGLQPF